MRPQDRSKEKQPKEKSFRLSLPLGRQLILLLAGAVIVAVLVSVYLGYVFARGELHQEVDDFLEDRATEFLGLQAGENQSTAFQSADPDNTPQAFLTLWEEARELFDYRASSLLRNDSWMQLLIYDTESNEMRRLPLGGYGFWPLPAEDLDWEIAMGTQEATHRTIEVDVLEPNGDSGDETSVGIINQVNDNGFVPNTGISGNRDGWSNTLGVGDFSSTANTDSVSAPLVAGPSSDAAVIDTLNLRVYTMQIGSGVALQIGRDLGEIDGALGDLRDRVIKVGIAIMLLAALFGWILGRRLAKPVKHLARKTETISETLDLTTPVEVKGSTEVAQLATSFNKMLATLNQSREQQRQLIADASHELRTPLTSLRTNIEMLARDIVTDSQEREDILADAEAEIVEFSKIVDELMELNYEVHNSEENMLLALDDLAEEVAMRTRRQSHREINVIAKDPQEVLCYEVGLKRAVSNLLSNAVKFSPSDSPIEVNVTGTQLEVRDHGNGINNDHCQKVFDRFYREIEARGTAGSGLGLAIVHQIVDNHGGEVWAKNHPEGGAIVGFKLPSVEENGKL